ncbi:Predicted ester cyclase [Franzmannia pantelleriensis]|uniref:Predicted ester cyclase n=1 Tax=Franzmannia pantelleriensis TaxID=48727 RepID=A0A1G9SKL3_9GAMM|nr:ester cyclase [Halomonas pantelleriensis]SDM36026.1 Predicted ester cyclase [Halomonas pantelleriensis]
MHSDELSAIYRDYIACLNQQDWGNLGRYVSHDVSHNGNVIGLSGYRAMLEGDFEAIPDLYFNVALLISQPPHIASRLQFNCTPVGILFGLPVNGKPVKFDENVFYEFNGDGKIQTVWSIIDKSAIAEQI